MKRVHVLVEGQTEEAFVTTVLQPHLHQRRLHLEATIVTTKRVAAGPNFTGGIGSWGKIKTNLDLLLRDTSVAAVTTLIDYYGLPTDTPGMGAAAATTPLQAVVEIEAAIDAAFPSGKVRSHLALHEYEALLYTDPTACATYLRNNRLGTAMSNAVVTCGEPELVNDNPSTTPSRRILQAHPQYRKTTDGPTLAARIGLPKIRSACHHFDQWLTWLEHV